MAAKPKKESKKEPKDKRLRWAERLARLTGISVEEALEIAKAKEDYHAECILDLENRQCNDFSRRREKIIRTKERENPLRRIEDEDHAEAILYAHARHTDTDYEDYLAAANDLVIRGHLTHDDKRGWARAMAQGQAWAKDIYSALTY